MKKKSKDFWAVNEQSTDKMFVFAEPESSLTVLDEVSLENISGGVSKVCVTSPGGWSICVYR